MVFNNSGVIVYLVNTFIYFTIKSYCPDRCCPASTIVFERYTGNVLGYKRYI